MMQSTKNPKLRELIFKLVVARMDSMRAELKDKGTIDVEEYQLLFSLFLELAPDEAISQVIEAFQDKGLLSNDPILFDA